MASGLYRKYALLTFILCFAISMNTGCGRGTATGQTGVDNAENRNSGNITVTKETSRYSTRFKYTMNMLDAEMAGRTDDGKIAANFDYFCKKFNIEFEFWPVTWDNWIEKCRIWIFSGDMPDILFMDIAPARFNEYSKAAKQGAFKALPDFGTKYPNLQKYKDKMESTKYFTIDGKMYAWPKFRDSEEFNFASYWQYMYRRDWAEKLGMAKPDNIYTWEEWLALIKACVDKDPGGNGPGKTVGMGGPKWTLPKFMGGGSINPYFWTYTKVDGKYVWGPTMPESIELVKTFKKMYDDGIIWRDMVIAKTTDAQGKYLAGQMAAMPTNSPVSVLASFRESFKNANPDIEDVEKATQLALVRDKNGKIYANQTEDYWSCIAFNPKMDDEKFDRILTAYDWLASDDGYNFSTLGIPGVDWKMVDGKPQILWNKDSNGIPQYPYEKGGEYWMAVSLTESFDLYSPAYPRSIRDEVLNFQRRKLQSDSNLIPFDYDVAFFSAPNYDRIGTMEAQVIDKLCELLVSSRDIEYDWKAWLKEMEPKYRLVEEELNRAFGK